MTNLSSERLSIEEVEAMQPDELFRVYNQLMETAVDLRDTTANVQFNINRINYRRNKLLREALENPNG